jgi:DNA-binding SARP family transcriptional activator
MLALHANRVVTSQELMGSVWGPESTATRRSLQWQVWQLRRLLGTHADRLVYRAPGYLLRVEPGELDLARFQDLADQGRELLAAGDAEEAGRLLGAALALWRGRALEDVQVAALAEQGARLEQRRLAVAEDRVQADLDAGRGDGLVAELEGLVAAEPLRERLTGLLMVALYRSGRQADALAAFRALRQRLVEQQGVEPGRPVQELQRRILAADPDLDPPAAATADVRVTAPEPVPRQLPPDVASFTGREPELVQLERALAAAGRDGPVVISAIEAPAGSASPPWRSMPPTDNRGASPTGSCTSISTVPPRDSSPWRHSRSWAASSARWARSRPPSPPAWRRRAPRSARGWPAGGCWWSWTTPSTPRRCVRCCPPLPAAGCW